MASNTSWSLWAAATAPRSLPSGCLMPESALVFYREIDSPVGRLVLLGAPAGLAGIHFQSGAAPMAIDSRWTAEPGVFDCVVRQLEEYFAGVRRHFDVPLTVRGTPFQRCVWTALQAIPFGAVCSYGDIARQVGRPRAFRAVGRANGANPWPIVVPCHRVIGSDRSLTGFGGGVDLKRMLLQMEARYCA
jgi:methylated-DNA-[protein]-cysteine S-methyltransferase